MQKILHTPEGVRDIYSTECEQKLILQEKLHNVIRSFGYHDIETPTFEYFDVFGRDIGTIPSRELFKFFDREGETLVLRPDFTPSIARAAAKYFLNEDMAVRLTYLGNTFINNSSYQGRLKETTQIGGELIGDDSADADAESIALTVQLLLASGLKDFQISIGHVGFFHALAAEAGLDEGLTAQLQELIANKNTFGVQKLLSDKEIPPAQKKAFSSFTGLFGTQEILAKARELTENAQALSALDRLQEIWDILCMYGVSKYVSFDLGMLSSYMYYTGITFRGYTFGTGDAVIKGGRYDRLLHCFGKDAPAVGFVAVVDELLSALSRQKITQEISCSHCMLLYEKDQLSEAVTKASSLRSQGIEVELVRITEDRTREKCRNYAKNCTLVVEL
ncbi:MAG: ATP phosphoribosyltransferase regulatory subunit [Lachnospiraceae bacterium]|uniref:ATP phosphoribosyltransferase regulatory subunit n=1 Tax=Parablautia sp. Marseille-Q6255 TaxID=3039593 RepID=UPI0024BC2E6D|nr:ATP phosphoribosyltransferase regulatory subunit [Parablautia sp. Marseille-Q6255]